MDDCEKFNEIWLPEKQEFYSHLSMEDITDAYDKDAKRIYKDFEIRILGDFYVYYIQR